MHVIHLTAPVDLGKSLGVLQPGDYVVQDQNAFEIALLADRGSATISKYLHATPNRLRYHRDGQRASESVLFMRSGAIGDLLLLGPAIRAFRNEFPLVPVFLSCRAEHHSLFENSKLVDSLLPYPLPLEMACECGSIHSLEDVMELATDKHATDAFADVIGCEVKDYKPVYVVSDEEKAKAALQMTSKRPKVGVQICASVHNRNYPIAHWGKVITGLEDRGWEVFLFGTPGQVPPFPPEMRRTFVHDMSQSGLTFRETAAMLSLCDAFVGVDSALIHLCHALDVAAVGLYAAFDWRIRTSKAPKTHALTGIGECAPCFWHAKNGQHFPDKECRTTRQCSVLASISHDRIIAKIDSMKP